MDALKLKIINDLSEKIEKTERSISVIDSLLSSCGISILISGTPASRRSVLEYRYGDKKEIQSILEKEKQRLAIILSELKKEFSDL